MSSDPPPDGRAARSPRWPWFVVGLAAILGLALIADESFHASATYDEVTYLQVAARWWRTGEQATITRMGSPLTFWKLQQAPTLFLIDHWGDRAWIDDPINHQARLLPLVRIGGSWIWLVGLGLVASWARSWYGPRAMAFAAVMFALSPNLLAHGALVTMELPIVVTGAGMIWAFSQFLRTGSRLVGAGSAAVGGLAFSCKYTAVLIPPILAVVWAVDQWRRRDRTQSPFASLTRTIGTVGVGMVGFGVVMVVVNLVVTGFATLPLSPRSGGHHPVLDQFHNPLLARCATVVLERSWPEDWVGVATQIQYQRQGGPSYLLGLRRTTGWWYYYPVCLAVKVPLAVWFLLAARWWYRAQVTADADADRRDWVIPVVVGLFVLAAVVGSKRNYGFRYLLPLAPLAIVYVSALANLARPGRWVSGVGLGGMALALGSIHPYELAYFNVLAGGPVGGRRVLADSNLDWGQGAVAMAQLQREAREFRDTTWYYFGDTDPIYYGFEGYTYLFDAHPAAEDLPPAINIDTSFVAVSASLQWGPWGPPGYFQILNEIEPVRYSADHSVAIYRTLDLIARREALRIQLKRGRGPG